MGKVALVTGVALLATMVADIVGYKGPIRWDRSKPNGTPRKLLDSTLMRSHGWRPTVTLRDGIAMAYEDYRRRHEALQ